MEIYMQRGVQRVVLTFLFVIVSGIPENVWAQLPPPQYISGVQSQALGRTISSKPLNVLDATFNPAGLSTFRSIASTLSLANTEFGGLNASFGIVIPTKQYGAFGLSYYTFRGDLTVFDGNTQFSTYSYNLNTAIISYGHHILENLAVGIGGKIVYFSFGPNKSEPKNIGITVSLQYQLPFQQTLLRDFQIGFLVENLIQPQVIDFDQRRRRGLPREFRVLIEKSFQFAHSELNLINNIVRLNNEELNELTAYPQYYAYWGLQYSYRSLLFLRAGYIRNNLVWGGGVKINRFILDYAFGDYNSDFPRTFYFKHFISLSIILKPKL